WARIPAAPCVSTPHFDFALSLDPEFNPILVSSSADAGDESPSALLLNQNKIPIETGFHGRRSGAAAPERMTFETPAANRPGGNRADRSRYIGSVCDPRIFSRLTTDHR